ncbi:MAG: recombination mediator RecR [Planctomycetota bacterium]
MGSSSVLEQVIAELMRLPGIGAKSADRLAYHLLKVSRDEALALAAAITRLKNELHECRDCHDYTENEQCAICADPKRERTALCVVEQSRDLHALEQSGCFRGRYHVLGGNFSPLEDRGPESLTLRHLIERVRTEGIREVIIATNPDFEGDGTALLVAERLRPTGVHITRLARGVPTGSQLEYMNRSILRDALTGRQRFSVGADSDGPDSHGPDSHGAERSDT